MKKLILILVVILHGFGFAQNRKDIITKSFDIVYLNKLLLEVCNERTSIIGVFKQSNSVTFKCAEYQSSYQAKYSICTHDSYNTHRGMVLEGITDRINKFNTSKKLNGSAAEICTLSPFIYGVTTYEELVNNILNNFYNSEPHRLTILLDFMYGDFSCSVGRYEGRDVFYVTGFFST